jgi:uncharacterized phage infection (PIP) family protein YhgE
MVDEEVENILREIRERVRAQEVTAPAVTSPVMGNGSSYAVNSHETGGSAAAEALARLEARLTITARAWDRLPPLLSNRSGTLARFELWMKRKIKSATHWFTWEQINFNASVHNALQDLLEAQRATQSSYSQALEKLGSELLETQQSNHEALENLRAEIERLAEAQRRTHETLAMLRAELKDHVEGQRVVQINNDQALADINSRAEADREQVGERRKELDERLSGLATELNARFERIQDEQRVCFKQLSLEATEAAVLEDRTRRKAEILLEEVSRRLEQLEKQ